MSDDIGTTATPEPAAVADPTPGAAPAAPEVPPRGVSVTRVSLRERFLGLPTWIRTLALVVIILILVGMVIWVVVASWPHSPKGSFGQPDGTAANALQEPDGPVDPADPDGVTSWTTWTETSLTNSDMEGSMIEAHDVPYHKYLAEVLQGEKDGKSYGRLFPKGTRFINCDYNVVNDGHYVFFWDTLDEDTWFLTFPDGTPAVKMTCGNTVIFPEAITERPKTPPPPEEEERCPDAPDGFDPRTPDGGSKTFQPPQERQEVARATDPAPDLVREVPEAITKDQETANPDQPSDYGAINPNPPAVPTPNDDGASDVTSGTVPGL